MGGVIMGGVTKEGGIIIGFDAPAILKRVNVEGLISDIVAEVSTGNKGKSDVGGVWGGLGGV